MATKQVWLIEQIEDNGDDHVIAKCEIVTNVNLTNRQTMTRLVRKEIRNVDQFEVGHMREHPTKPGAWVYRLSGMRYEVTPLHTVTY